MTRRFPLIAVLLLLPALAVSQQVTFSMKVPHEGITRAMIDTMELVALISVNAEGMDQAFDMTQGERRSYTETVLASDGKSITKRRISFHEAVEHSKQPMQPATVKTAPVAGNTYIVEYLADSIAVTAEDGSEAPKAERDVVLRQFTRNTEGQFNAILDGRSMSVGEEIELEGEMLGAFGAGLSQGPLKLRKAKFVLNSLGRSGGMKTAIFGIDVVMGGSQGMLEMEITMTGTAEVGVDNLWPLSLVMTGTLAGAGSHAGADLSADGDMKMARIATYE
jgi:hypothetical protein